MDQLWWQFFSWAVVLVTLIFLTQRGAVDQGVARALVLSVVKLLVAVSIIGFGYGLEPSLWLGLTDSPGKGLESLATQLGDNWYGLLSSGFIPGSLALLVATAAPNGKEAIQRAAIAVILCLAAADIVFNVVNSRPVENLLFSLFSDVLGGAIAGILVAKVAGLQAKPRPAPAAPSSEPG